MDQERPSYRIAVVSPEVRMVPIESVLIGNREFVGEVSSWWNWELKFRSVGSSVWRVFE